MADVVINVGAVSAITAGTGLTGGTITGTGTIAADFGTTAGTICQGNDARLTAPVAPLAHNSTHTAAGSDPLTLSQAQITNLGTDLAAKVAATRQVIAGTGMGGGGALSADVTLNVSYGTSGTTACVGNDARLSNARTPSTHASTHSAGQPDAITITQAQVTSLVSDLALKASTTHAATHATGGTDVLTLGQAQITGLVSSLAAKALGATTMTAGTGLTGGGDLSANRSFAVAYGTTSTTATVGNDARLSFIASGAGATTRTLQDKLRDVVSVKDFGAVGDGSTNDTVAIQAAFTAAGSTNRAVYIPGTTTYYKISSSLAVPDGVTVFGDGFDSVIQTTDSSVNIFELGHDTVIKELHFKVPTASYSGNYNTQNAIYAGAKNNVTIENNRIQITDASNGILINQCRNVTIKGNIVFGATYQGENLPGAGNADIVTITSENTPPAASVESNRYVISGNYCLSNNGIGVCANLYGNNSDMLITNNICVALDPATCTVGGTWKEIVSDGSSLGTLRRRHGISFGYGNDVNAAPRSVISNNICRNTLRTGVYLQAGSGQITPSPILVIGNICSLNGQDTGISPSTTGNSSLEAGIWLDNINPNSVITGNVIYDFKKGSQGAINYIFSATTGVSGPTISNNFIIDSEGDGIQLVGPIRHTAIKNNHIVNSTRYDVSLFCTAALSTVGGVLVEGNVIARNNFNHQSVFLDQQSGTIPSIVKGNKFLGSDKTSAGSVTAAVTRKNTAIATTKPLYTRVIDNIIDNFHVGVALCNSNYMPATTRNFEVDFSRNTIRNSNYGFGISSSSTNSCTPICDNIFETGVTPISTNDSEGGLNGSASGYIARKDGTRFIVLNLNAIPGSTIGTWAVGDRVEYTTPTAGGFIGAVCTTAGSPGTWKTFGAISA